MPVLISFAALFFSIFLVQLGSGSLGPLDALAGAARGFTTGEIGLMGSAHFAGFFVGCWLAPRLIGQIGHSRAFAAAAAVGAMGALLHPVFEGPYYWAALRVLTGVAIASAYTVVESWMQAKVENRNRGRVFGVFRVVDLAGQITAQALIAVLDPASYAAYNIVAAFCCLCLLPLTLTRRMPPLTPNAPRLRPLKALKLSPTACLGIVVAGLTGAAFRMVGPIYAVEAGLDPTGIALFLSAAVFGGIAAQYPVGWLADKVDRRAVLLGISGVAVLACLGLMAWMDPGDHNSLYLGAFVFGVTAYPVYSVSAAYANDRAPADFIVELNAALVFFFSVGAIVSPLASAELITAYGPAALFGFAAAAHLVLFAFTLYRMSQRSPVRPTAPYRYMPRTSMVLARLFKRDGGENGNGNGRPHAGAGMGGGADQQAPAPRVADAEETPR
ncbi:MFS transporter [Paralimibaculum aggregatum]|uniref:MFS transporter n=1 Tax=Paralimibaculum aggregatum TaxID=3036245 RepID=A0ABQ6LNS4_9RHOB|nr:MFS transporter [Limibaculum sp. NKW23]GMG84870.1 MFS transporter [Limibaculum sp. NKW23]